MPREGEGVMVHKCFKSEKRLFFSSLFKAPHNPFRIDILIGKNGELFHRGERRVYVHREAGMWAMAVNSHIRFHVLMSGGEGKQQFLPFREQYGPSFFLLFFIFYYHDSNCSVQSIST